MPTEAERLRRKQVVDEAARGGVPALSRALEQALSVADRQRSAIDLSAEVDDRARLMLPAESIIERIAEDVAYKTGAELREEILTLREDLRKAGLDLANPGALFQKLDRAFSVPDSINKLAWSVAKGAATAIGGSILIFFGWKFGGTGGGK